MTVSVLAAVLIAPPPCSETTERQADSCAASHLLSGSLSAQSDVTESLGAVCLSDDAPEDQPQEASCK